MTDLKAIAKDAAERVHKNGGCVPQMAFAPILFALQDALAAAPASPLPGGGWQDISTAPKDGTEILIYRDGWQEAPRAKWGDHDGEDDQGNSIVFGGWFMASEWFTYGCEDGFLGWNDDSNVMPTHWMPLPAAPTGDAK